MSGVCAYFDVSRSPTPSLPSLPNDRQTQPLNESEDSSDAWQLPSVEWQALQDTTPSYTSSIPSVNSGADTSPHAGLKRSADDADLTQWAVHVSKQMKLKKDDQALVERLGKVILTQYLVCHNSQVVSLIPEHLS